MFSVLFPGQGSQQVGMCSDIYNKFDSVKKIFKTVDDILGYSLSKIVLQGPSEQLNLTENTQPAIMMVGFSIFSVLKEEYGINLNTAKYFAGHSLGEYTALVCADSLGLEAATYLLHERGKAMQNSVPPGKGSMLAILKLGINDILEEIKSISNNGVCEVANDNCPGQVVVSGDKESINILNNNLKKKSIRGVILPVSAPFHCSLMKGAEKNMLQKITNSKFKNPNPSIISNVTAKPENEVENIKQLLIRQITSRVRWRESLDYMIKNNVNEFIEIGPGKVLSGLVKRTNKNVKVFNIDSIDGITNYISK